MIFVMSTVIIFIRSNATELGKVLMVSLSGSYQKKNEKGKRERGHHGFVLVFSSGILSS